jgi:hypothetical protein
MHGKGNSSVASKAHSCKFVADEAGFVSLVLFLYYVSRSQYISSI